MLKIIQKFFLVTICLLFVFLGAVSLGALGEDYSLIGKDLNHVLNKTMAIILMYVAIKLPITILLKCTIINGCCAIVSWKAAIKKDYFKKLFTFRRQEVYYTQRKSLAYVNYDVKKIIPLLNKNVGLENKIRFCMNPVSILVAAIGCFKQYFIYVVDSLTNSISAHLHEKNYESTDITVPLNVNISPSFFRCLKGIVVMICELSLSILKTVQPIFNLPYWIAYFITISLPDFLVNLFSPEPAKKAIKVHLSTKYPYDLLQLHHNIKTNSKFIKEQLDNEKINDLSLM